MKNLHKKIVQVCIIIMFLPMIASAGPIEDLLRAALKVPAKCEEWQLHQEQGKIQDGLRSPDLQQVPTIESFCSALREKADKKVAQCYVKCESDFSRDFSRQKEALELKAENEAFAEERRRKVLEEKEASALREADLRAGRVKPTTVDEAVIVYNARPGSNLASAPKIKPDGAIYYMHGKITIASEKPEFLASITSSKAVELSLAIQRLHTYGQIGEVGDGTRYFNVVIPKTMQTYFFDNAKIEGGFDLVGRYVSNKKYQTVAGQEKSAPVFEAIYFRMW